MSISLYLTYLIGDIFTMITIIFAYKKIFNKQIEINIYKILLLFFQSSMIVFNNYYNISGIRFLCAIGITAIFLKIFTSCIFNEALLFTIINSAVSIIVQILTSILLISFTDVSILNEYIIIKLFYSLINSVIVMLILINKKSVSHIYKLLKIVNNNKKIFLDLTILIIVLNLLIVLRGLNLSNNPLFLTIILFIIFILFVINNSINDKYNINILEEKNKDLNNLFMAYSKTIDECRELKHNLKNDLYYLKSLIPNKNEAINELIVKYNTNYEWVSKINEIPEGLQGIIFLKQKEAQKYKIELITNSKKLSHINTKEYLDLSSIVGILLDNAITATRDSKKKVIDINIKENKNGINITIINSFTNRVNISKIGTRNYSTKKYKSGLGLNYINNLKSNIKVKFRIVNDLFIADIQYKKSELS